MEKTIRKTPEFSVEKRAASGDVKDFVVRGYAALYDTPSDAAGWYTEVIKKGAFSGALKKSDIRFLINHNDDHVLARYKPGRSNNTLKVWEDDKGLAYEFVMPRTQDKLMESIERGDINQNSFAFTLSENGDEWKDEGNSTTREIKEVDTLYDLSIVTYPFYKEATFTHEKRCYEEWKTRERIAERDKKIDSKKTEKNKAEDANKIKSAAARLRLAEAQLFNLKIEE